MPRNGAQDGQILPAYDTKHLKTLAYDLTLPTVPRQSLKLELAQDDTAGATTGTTLWLGGQVLAAYLLSLKRPTPKSTSNPRAIDLGSGIGYTSLLIAAAGYDVIATDLPILSEGILSLNVTRNSKHLATTVGHGKVQCCPLDWMTEPVDWAPVVSEAAYDLIFSSDSIYEPNLVKPLLQTILALCQASSRSLDSPETTKSPDVYIAYEHRDDAQYTSFTHQAEQMGFKVKIVPKGKVSKAVQGLYGWKAEVYEGITVLYLKLQRAKSGS